jgi:hypothetical protein
MEKSGTPRRLVMILGVLIAGVIVLIVIALIGTQGKILTGGVPLGGVGFTTGSIPGFPTYPGAEQSTDSSNVTVPDDMRRVIGSKEDQWKRYLTDDALADVIAWYEQAMVDAGFESSAPRDSGVRVYFQGDYRFALYVMPLEGRTNIILATGLE